MSAPTLPRDFPERIVLADEVHARPYEALETPEVAAYVAVLMEPDERPAERAHLVALCERFGVAPPPESSSHFLGVFGAVRLKWERHSEFSAYTAYLRGVTDPPSAAAALAALPADWVAAIPGRTIAAAEAALVPAEPRLPDPAALVARFGGNVVVGAEIGDGAGLTYTDFRIHPDGFVRFVLVDRSLTPRQAGRMMQRLFEIEAYRVMALLALPIARREGPRVVEIERSLATLTDAMARDSGADEALLGQLSYLAAQVESALAASQYRFGASRAYYDLVRARIAELRERRIPGLQTIEEFMSRRLAPAIATCESVSRRLGGMSERVARASSLLSARVDIARERQNQALLASMDRRARMQLRLQQTVEGLSIAAITYYVVGLVGYAAKALRSAGTPLDVDLVVGVAIPVVAVLAALGLRRVKHRIVGRLEA